MKIGFAVFRAMAGLGLVLTLVAGLFSVQGDFAGAQPAPASPSPEASGDAPAEGPGTGDVEATVEPSLATTADLPSALPSTGGEAIDGDAGANPGESSGSSGDSVVVGPIARQAVELRARTQAAGPDDTIGTTGFLFDTGGDFGPREIDASIPRAGATFQVLDENNTVVQTVITDASGVALLDARPDDYVWVLDVQSGTTTEIFYLEEDTRPILTATLFVAADALADDDTLYTIAADHIELRARTVEAPAGESGMVAFAIYTQSEFDLCVIFPFLCGEGVSVAQVDDSAPASDYRFLVVATTGDGAPTRVIDEATTGPDGIVLLDVPVGVPYVIREAGTGMESGQLSNTAEEIRYGRTQIVAAITVPVTGGANTNPDGVTLPYAIATDNLELRLRYVQDLANDGTAIFDFGNVERDLPGEWPGPEIQETDSENGDSVVAAGVSVSILDANNTVVDRGVTNDLGELLLDTPVLTGGLDGPGATDGSQVYTVLVEGYAASRPIFSPTAADVDAGRDTVSGILWVADLNDVIGTDPDVVPSPAGPATGSVAPSATPFPPSIPPFPDAVIADGVTVTGLVSERYPERAGEYRYFIDLVGMTDEDDSDLRYATEGEITFEVLTVDAEFTLVVIDSGATNENGVVMLDIPADVPYFVAATDDTSGFYGSDDIASGQMAAVVAIKYVAGGEAPSAVASAAASASVGDDGDSDDDGPGGGDDNGADPDNDGGTRTGDGDGAGTADGTGTGTGTSPGTSGTGNGGGPTVLPNTGAGATNRGMTITWAMVALMAVAGVAAAGFGHRLHGT